ncbi:ABC transporter permease [Cohnella pontilimi]|uniref:ABC transporter permease n=1 Tax=Cohnella pontilimi TaxID=2564100 RepID=A0A4U0F7M7_9BACL|nr:ABC transporter permease [Cohnella pontilimi]TJY40683.1 ABC transporter permease [Cohnella pontilimi]
MIHDMWQYVMDHREEFTLAIREHVLLSLVSLIAAVLVGVLIGILCAKYDKLANPIIGVFTFLRLIPSIALLIVFMPILKTGFMPTAFALTILALPAICINTYSGLTGVDRFAIESATGLGLSKRDIFTKVEFPLAMPLILVGIRSAFIDVISSATLAAIVGGGGLGIYIFRGMMMNDMVKLVLGGISIAVIALLAEVILSLVQRRYSRFI